MSGGEQDHTEERGLFLSRWHQAEKKMERYGGLLLIFSGALVLAFDQPGDQLSALAAAAFIATGVMFIIRSRRPASERTYLYFLSYREQSSRAIGSGVSAFLMMTQAAFTNRPLLWIFAAVLCGVALWYRWRGKQVQRYDTFFNTEPTHKQESL